MTPADRDRKRAKALARKAECLAREGFTGAALALLVEALKARTEALKYDEKLRNGGR